MSSDGKHNQLVEDLMARSAELFSEYGHSEPKNLQIRPRNFPNLQPKFSRSDNSILLVEIDDPKEYYSQICWLLANLVADDNERFLVRRAVIIEWILVMVFAIDTLFALFIPTSMDLIPGLFIFVLLQSSCLFVVWQGKRGKADRERILSEIMVKTGIWKEEYADWYSQAKAEFWQYIPLVGVSVITPIALMLFFV